MDHLTIGLLIAAGWIILTLASWAFECHTNYDRGVSWGYLIGSSLIGPPIVVIVVTSAVVIVPLAGLAWLLAKIYDLFVGAFPSIPAALERPIFRAPRWFGRMAFRCPVKLKPETSSPRAAD